MSVSNQDQRMFTLPKERDVILSLGFGEPGIRSIMVLPDLALGVDTWTLDVLLEHK